MVLPATTYSVATTTVGVVIAGMDPSVWAPASTDHSAELANVCTSRTSLVIGLPFLVCRNNRSGVVYLVEEVAGEF
ncbi:hypothetical protein C5E02_13180 [Rathayibacter rathayi]|uniref:GAF domain-containing protein n=1 Tax=Rathayibacter rathayi TaxID=33887 RepID=A0ABX5A962_RATRA|nr:hypothetical protein C5C34_09465 [Rathayibacter rathayi]PPG92735.1 hypothetical protein C5C22_12315 [Rathayibacter rathayi]PPH33141.1 hypothetical protein C5C28_11445 [Rathayibacter rathayi]PPH74711.1 hypothetical protein C5C40_12740 [Rathayibacter rathayi]PPI58649.1 hypothetical protein C5E02_13180 [Rathayibacter rathayi]